MSGSDRRWRGARTEHRRNAAGMASLWAVGWIAVCLTVSLIGMGLAAGEAGQHHADGAADLVSLSAAARLQRGGDACAAASAVAAANHVVLGTCRVVGADVVVTVRCSIQLPFGIHRLVVGAARAGPI